MSELFWILVPLFLFISLAYTSVGLGGGSSYVAFLALFGISLAEIPPIALFLNIIAASVALYRFGKRGHFFPKLVLPFLLASIPATYIGAQLILDEKILSIIFTAILFLIALLVLFKKKEVKSRLTLDRKMTWFILFPLGALLGFLAGIMGVGGGVFLGPILLLAGMASSREAASACAAFVLVNSVVGLISHYFKGGIDFSILFFLGFAVFVGALIGSFLGTKKFSPLLLQRIFALILLGVSFKLGMSILG
jgi:uncharacterized membrane protein YfcA